MAMTVPRPTSRKERRAEGEDFFPIQRLDYVEFYVGNARQAVHYYQSGFGFNLIGYLGPETGVRDRASYLLEQGQIRFIFTSPLFPEGPIAEHVYKHGDGVRDIAFQVPDAISAHQAATERGAVSEIEPTTVRDENGSFTRAAIRAYGDTIHSIIQRSDYHPHFLPGFRPVHDTFVVKPTGIKAVDHMVANVELGKMDEWVNFYANTLGFQNTIHFDDKTITTEYSALMSKVMENGNGRVKFPINEPAAGRKKSQIQEYLDYYLGPGVQHIALATADIVATVREMESRGVEFMPTPHSYYEALPERIGPIKEDYDTLEQLSILADRDDEGYLLQIFTRPVEDRPTLFYEIIERHGARGFGAGNFKALFEAIEREQEARGNL